MKVVTSKEIIDFEQNSKLSTEELIEKASKSITCYLNKNIKKNSTLIFLIGPGNNGKDGLNSIKFLEDNNVKIKIFLLNEKNLNHDIIHEISKFNTIEIFQYEKNIFVKNIENSLEQGNFVYIIDAIFGIGLKREIIDPIRSLIIEVNGLKKKYRNIKIISIDIPSGINSDTGDSDFTSIEADITLGIGLPKIGYFLKSASNYIGKLEILDIGFTKGSLSSKINYLYDYDPFPYFPKRSLNSHKGTYGKILAVVGSRQYIGTAYLVAKSALRSGAGLVTLAIPESLQNVMGNKMVESTYLLLPESSPGVVSPSSSKIIIDKLKNYNTLVIGPGLGLDENTKKFFRNILYQKIKLPTLIDADGLNILSEENNWWKYLSDQTILTPHLGEFSKLANIEKYIIERDRINAIFDFIKKTKITTILKGAYPIITTLDGEINICPFANPLLSTAGTGDVKTGIIGGLLAQGTSIKTAAILGTWIHGKIGEKFKFKFGTSGLLASDMIDEIPLIMKKYYQNFD